MITDPLVENRVTVIIVTYNSHEVITAAIESIPDGTKIIVIDNASVDSTCSLLQEHYPHVKLVINQENLGFGRANNIGLEITNTEFALLMNPDARLFPTTITGLVQTADHYPNAAILSPGIEDESGNEQLTLRPSILSKANKNHSFSMAHVCGETCAEILSGSTMLLRMNIFHQLGHFFDPRIFMYYEDDDLCLSVRKAGFSCILAPQVKIIHLLGQSSGSSLRVESLKVRSRVFSTLYLLHKYSSHNRSLALAVKLLLISILKTVASGLLLNKRKALIALSRYKGAIDYLKYLTLKSRNK